MRLSLLWKRHWRLAAAAASATALLLFALGGIRVAAVDSSPGGHPRKGDIAGTTDLFDAAVVHSIEVSFDEAEYDAAMEAFSDSGEKDFIQADVVIDGTAVQSVGIRLKGNSTLFGPGPGIAAPAAGDGEAAPTNLVGSDEPEDLPWLISFGEYVDGQTYQGHDAIAVRPAGLQGEMTTALNEALSLSLIALAGEPAEEAAYAAFSVNGAAAALRLIVQEPGDSLVADDFAGQGVLYKALSGGTFACRGEDPLAYDDSFRQVTGQNQADLAPLSEFVCWVEESSDEEFGAGLADRVDVASLARYLALHNLLLDFDDMSGPGQNYYLRYSAETGRFTVVSWDLNLSWSGEPDQGPFEQGSWSPGARPRPGGDGAGAPPGGPASGPGLPDEAGPVGPGIPPGGGGNLGGRGGHMLEERFLEVEGFRAAYEEAYRDIYGQVFAGGVAREVLEGWAETLGSVAGELVDATTLEEEVAMLRELISARTAALGEDEVVGG